MNMKMYKDIYLYKKIKKKSWFKKMNYLEKLIILILEK